MAKIILVTSGKGGVGKTTTSASFAAGLALRGHKTAVIDFDVGLRNLDLIMGCERRVVYDLINVIQGEANLNQALIKDKQCDNLFVLAAVSFGAEVIADGHIHVYAPLRGRAIAGAQGNVEARIFATCMQPQLVSIAGTYRTTETELPADVLGKPAQVRLVGDRLVVEPLAS